MLWDAEYEAMGVLNILKQFDYESKEKKKKNESKGMQKELGKKSISNIIFTQRV